MTSPVLATIIIAAIWLLITIFFLKQYDRARKKEKINEARNWALIMIMHSFAWIIGLLLKILEKMTILIELLEQ